jgi:hypothetical protein
VDPQSDDIQALNSFLNHWQQGDCVLGEFWFVHRADFDLPLTEGAEEAAKTEDDLIETQEIGFCVLSQTCDIVRDSLDRPYINVAPLLTVNAQTQNLQFDVQFVDHAIS